MAEIMIEELLKKAAEYLSAVGNMSATPFQFAEFFVLLYNMQERGETDIKLTADMVKDFPIEDFSRWLSECLDEIIRGNADCREQWWKHGEKPVLKCCRNCRHYEEVAAADTCRYWGEPEKDIDSDCCNSWRSL